jgi:hypothetical protein
LFLWYFWQFKVFPFIGKHLFKRVFKAKGSKVTESVYSHKEQRTESEYSLQLEIGIGTESQVLVKLFKKMSKEGLQEIQIPVELYKRQFGIFKGTGSHF